MLTLPLISTHDKLADAVAKAGIDLSYNETWASQRIAMIQNSPGFVQAFVLDFQGQKRACYELKADIRLLNLFSPFEVVLNDSAFSIVNFKEKVVEISDPCLPRSLRASLANSNVVLTVL